MNSGKKGAKNEGRCVEAFERAGYIAYTPQRVTYGDNDIFGLFDVAAHHPRAGLVLTQVKSNVASGIREWCEKVDRFRVNPGIQVRYAVRHDGEGWRLLAPAEHGHVTIYDGRKETAQGRREAIDERFAAYLWNQVRP